MIVGFVLKFTPLEFETDFWRKGRKNKFGVKIYSVGV